MNPTTKLMESASSLVECFLQDLECFWLNLFNFSRCFLFKFGLFSGSYMPTTAKSAKIENLWKQSRQKLPPQRWLRCCLYSGPLLVCTATLWPLLQRNSELPVCQWRVSRAGVMSGPAAAENVVEWSECHSCPSEWQRYHGNLESDSPPAFYLCLEALNCPLFAKNPDLAGSLFRWASDNSHPASLKFSAKLSANIFFIRREGGKASAEEVNH